MEPHPLTDLELLALQAGMSMDAHGRLAGVRSIMIATARVGQLLFVGSDVPDALVPALVDAVSTSPRAPAPHLEPPAIAACRAILEPSCAPLFPDAGPSYLIPPDIQAEVAAYISRSDRSPTEPLRALNPGNWGDGEWDELLDGTLGPWAMAVADGRVVSICHTPRRMTEHAAECGVWTHPEYRGQGYASATTADWADVLRPSGRHLFYSTDWDNRHSQRVAARLRLRPIGWMWSLTGAKRLPQERRHPLNRWSP